MSNALAIATVTETMRYKIHMMLPGSGVGGAHVTTLRPDSAHLPAVGVNIFLFQVTPNLAFQNSDLPTRRADGTLLRRPQAAIDLHYLLTFYGDDATLDQQRLLGATMLEFHAAPVLSRDIVHRVQNYIPFLNSSNLADQIDLVRVRPANLSLDDMNKLWMTFPNVDYALSVAYVAGVVLIETDDLTAAPALPVARWRVTAVPLSLASIDAVSPEPVDLSSSSPTQITLIGSHLDPADTVTFTTPGGSGPLIGSVQSGTGGGQLVVALPATGLHPGANAVQLTQVSPATSSPPSPARPIARSNAAAFVIRPAIVNISYGSPPAQVVVEVSPPVGPQQQVSLLLNQLPTPPPQASLPLGQLADSPPLAFAVPAGPRTTDTTKFPFDLSGIPSGSIPPELVDGRDGSIPAGTYLARINVDGIASRLETDVSGKFNGPTVMI